MPIQLSQSFQKNSENKAIVLDIKQSVANEENFTSLIDENFYFFNTNDTQQQQTETKNILFFRKGANINSTELSFILEQLNNQESSYTVDMIFKLRKNLYTNTDRQNHLFLIGTQADNSTQQYIPPLESGLSAIINNEGKLLVYIGSPHTGNSNTFDINERSGLNIDKNKWYYLSVSVSNIQKIVTIFLFDYRENSYKTEQFTFGNMIPRPFLIPDDKINCMYNIDGSLLNYRIWNTSFDLKQTINNVSNINIIENENLICNINLDEGIGFDLFDKSGESIDFKLKNINNNTNLVDIDGNDLYLPEWRQEEIYLSVDIKSINPIENINAE